MGLQNWYRSSPARKHMIGSQHKILKKAVLSPENVGMVAESSPEVSRRDSQSKGLLLCFLSIFKS